MSIRLLALLVLGWTLLSWGGRIGLLTDADASDPWSLARIAVSLVLGLATAALLAFSPDRADWLRWTFSVWTVLLWARSLVVTWVDGPSLAFGLVHTVLAVGWFVLAWLVAPRRARTTGTREPANHARSRP